jgi:hypothetical protein
LFLLFFRPHQNNVGADKKFNVRIAREKTTAKKAEIKSFSDDAKIICQRDKKFLPAVKGKIFW